VCWGVQPWRGFRPLLAQGRCAFILALWPCFPERSRSFWVPHLLFGRCSWVLPFRASLMIGDSALDARPLVCVHFLCGMLPKSRRLQLHNAFLSYNWWRIWGQSFPVLGQIHAHSCALMLRMQNVELFFYCTSCSGACHLPSFIFLIFLPKSRTP